MVARAGVLTDDKPFRISVEICDGVSRHRPTEALSRDAKMIFIEAEQSSGLITNFVILVTVCLCHSPPSRNRTDKLSA
jgi:hypothetical protein